MKLASSGLQSNNWAKCSLITQDLPYQILTDGLDLIKDEIAM